MYLSGCLPVGLLVRLLAWFIVSSLACGIDCAFAVYLCACYVFVLVFCCFCGRVCLLDARVSMCFICVCLCM